MRRAARGVRRELSQSGRPHPASTSFQDASPGDSPPATPPASPVSSTWQPFPEEDSDSPQFRRRAHTFSHPPSSARRRITFQNGRSQSVRSPLLRQTCVDTARWVRACRATRLLSPEVLVHEPQRVRSYGSCFCTALFCFVFLKFIYLFPAFLLCLRVVGFFAVAH